MNTPPTSPVVAFGVLQADGTVRLNQPLAMPPGPSQMAIRPVTEPVERVPDLVVDDFIQPVSCNLPRLSAMQDIQPTHVLERLPDPL
jgi:hypothetical protein